MTGAAVGVAVLPGPAVPGVGRWPASGSVARGSACAAGAVGGAIVGVGTSDGALASCSVGAVRGRAVGPAGVAIEAGPADGVGSALGTVAAASSEDAASFLAVVFLAALFLAGFGGGPSG
ncbi:MAG: hypothetical protein WCI74_08625 [Actinomycetes bacterium]